MKRIIWLIALCLLLAPAALAQTVTMESAHVTFVYPDSWLVLSPQLARVYAPLLEQEGIDAQQLSEDMSAQGVLSRAYNEDFTQSMSVLAREDDLAFEIYDIAAVTEEQRKTIRRRAENGELFETTGMRVQDIEWQREDGLYYLYLHYTIGHGEKTIGRGIRYITIFNGRYVMLDWQKKNERFSNRDLNAFRDQIADLTVEKVPEPLRPVRLEAQIPTETSTREFVITGETTANADLIASTPAQDGSLETLSVGKAESSGRFSLLVELPEEGAYPIILTAGKEGMLETSAEGAIVYSAKTLPVSGIPETLVSNSDETLIAGETLPGVQIQLVTPFGLTKKRSDENGKFKFGLTTDEEGDYDYTLILDKSGYDQRRIRFTITREMTDQQTRSSLKENAEAISYKNLQRDLPENRGKTLSIRGPVAAVSSGGGVHYVRLYYNKDANGKWYNPVIIAAQEDMGVSEGQMLSVVVTVDGVYEEQDSMGETVYVPSLSLVFVDKIE